MGNLQEMEMQSGMIEALLPRRGRLVGLAEEERALLATISRPVEIADGVLLFEEGHRDSWIYVVVEGVVELGNFIRLSCKIGFGPYGDFDFADDDELYWQPIRELRCGECLGEVNRPHRYSARTVGMVRLLVWDSNDLSHLLTEQTALAGKLCKAFGEITHH